MDVGCVEQPQKSVTNDPSMYKNGYKVTANSNSSANSSYKKVIDDSCLDKSAGIIKTDSWSALSASLGNEGLSPGWLRTHGSIEDKKSYQTD